MKRYTLTFTDHETGETQSVDCEAFFASAAEDDEHGKTIIQNMTMLDIAAGMAENKKLREAARIAVAMMDATAYERQQSSPFASAIIQAIRES